MHKYLFCCLLATSAVSMDLIEKSGLNSQEQLNDPNSEEVEAAIPELPPEILSLILDYALSDTKTLHSILLTNSVFNKLAHQAQLHLDLSNIKNKITDDMLAQIVTLFPNIVSINLSKSEITDTGLTHLSNLANLKILDLSSCSLITGESFELLAKLPKLENLNLSSNKQLNDNDITNISALSSLKKLNLSGCSLTGNSLQFIGNLGLLEELNLNFNKNFQDSDFDNLINLRNLRTLRVIGSNISQEAILKLQKSLPNLTIYNQVSIMKRQVPIKN